MATNFDANRQMKEWPKISDEVRRLAEVEQPEPPAGEHVYDYARNVNPIYRIKHDLRKIEKQGSGLPEVTPDDAGKFLRVNSEGVWAAETVPDAESEEF